MELCSFHQTIVFKRPVVCRRFHSANNKLVHSSAFSFRSQCITFRIAGRFSVPAKPYPMSVVESHEFVNDLNEADFPYLSKFSGKRADKGRRSGVERVAARTLADQVTVVKTVHDPQNVLGKRRKARLASTCSDNIALDVPYSLNRKNRWEEIDVHSLAKNAENSEVEVAIIEENYKANEMVFAHRHADKAKAVHLVSTDRSVKSNYAHGRGAATASLMNGLKQEVGSDDDSDNEVRLEYRITRPHSNINLLCQSGKVGKAGKQRNKTRRNKKVDLDELEISEMENSYHCEADNDVYKPSRDFRFCLGDYIKTSNNCGAVEIRRASIESVQPLDVDDTPAAGPRPIDLLDISSAVRAPGVFETVFVNTSRWPAFNFVQQVDSLTADEDVVVRWIDANHQRAVVDLTKKVDNNEDDHKLQFVIVLEKGRKGHFRLLLNCSIPSNGPFNWKVMKSTFSSKNVQSIGQAIETLITIVTSWKTREPKYKKQYPVGSRYFVAGENFDVLVNSRAMSKPAAIISYKEMCDIMREASKNLDGDSFERIDDDDIISGDSQSEDDSTVQNFSVKCHTCMENMPEELFELDDYWQCRECLRQHIVNLIRTKNIPMEIPFVVSEDGSAFDVLPALIPLPLINFYTKLTALDIIQSSEDDIGDLLYCPACQKDVRVEIPNEFRSCLCTNCYTVWCPDCNTEPHWPLSCDQFAEWTSKWQQQYAVESMKDELSKYIRRIHCGCGGIIECGDLAVRCECNNCGISFNPTTLKIESKHYFPYPPRFRKYHKQFLIGKEPHCLDVKEIALIPVLRVIKKEFAEPCAAARSIRFNRRTGADIERKCRKLKEADTGIAIFPDVRRTIMCLVEHGLAWIYMNKGVNVLKTGLIQLFKQCDELTNDILEGKTNLGSRVSALDSALDKMMEQFKKAL